MTPDTPRNEFVGGRVPFFDPRSREHPVLSGAATRPVRKTWRVYKTLDQLKGRNTQFEQMGCCGFATAGELNAEPVRVPVNNDSGYSLYLGAKQRDPYPDDQGGTSLIFAVQEAQARGYYTGYRWCFDISALLWALAFTGPVLLGSAWLEGMNRPTWQGVVHARGEAVGGHGYLAYGYDLSKRFPLGHNRYTKRRAYLACVNSYGGNGRFWLPLDEWEGVLMHHPQQAAEMCVPTGRTQP